MAEDKTWYRPGLVFQSKMSAHEEYCRSYKAIRNQYDGTVFDEIPALVAEFAFHGGEYTYIDPDTGNTAVAADIRGHFFDLYMQAEEKGWSDDDKEVVARHMLRMCEKFPGGEFWVWEKPRTLAPWPTYDTTAYAKIADLALELGLVEQAINYELENKNRENVLKRLAAVKADAPVDELDEELVAS